MKPGSVDSNKALEQWEALILAYKENGIEVETINQIEGLSDMPFAADQGLIVDQQNKVLVLSNFKYSQRKEESDTYKTWFEKNGFTVEILPSDLNFEGGGECIPWNGQYFIGEGFRNSSGTHKYITQKFGTQFISLKLIDEKYYHLDTCFFVLDSETAFYYPKAFSQDSINILNKLFSNLYEFSEDEMSGFAPNSVVSGQIVFVQKGNPSFNKKLQSLGYDVIEVDISEFIKSGGGIHCLTFELEREPHFKLSLKKQSKFKTTLKI
jgi:N-dimethylarginine dimethylaminohydrolase